MRELVVLGTASQVPTRHRNHNGYLLRWDDEGILFDPGEGTQRQMLRAGVAASDVTRICVTHFHGDHSLGLPGVIQRISLDRVPHPVVAHFPAGGAHFFARLRHATSFYDHADIREAPITGDGPIPSHGAITSDGPTTSTGPITDHKAAGEQATAGEGRKAAGISLEARRLYHSVETYGYRLTEPDGRRMLPDRLAAYGIEGPRVGALIQRGRLDVDGRRVSLDEVSAPRPGQKFAFVMDTGLCDNVFALAEGVDMLVIEATFLSEDAAMAELVGHLTAAQAARVATESGVRRLVLTHFSQRYDDPARFAAEAREHFEGDLVVAEDLMRVPMPARRQITSEQWRS